MKTVGVERVSVRFGRVNALEAVDFAVDRGDVVMLAGPNGAGKSTLIRVLLGLVRPDAGTLKIDGKARVVDNAFKRTLGYLPEAVAFAENLSGRQVLRFFASARGVPRKRIDEVLARVGLRDAARRAVRGYSRGMRQRLGIGLAILSEPELLILDEPTGGLDQEGLGVLWSVLSQWRDAGRMVVLASHDLALLERHVDRICLLKQGRVCAFDRPQQLRASAALPVRVTLNVGRTADALATLRRVFAARGYAETDADGKEGRLIVEVEPNELLGLLDVCAEHEVELSNVRVEEPGLDLVYEKLLEGVA